MKNILIIDDSVEILDLLQEMLVKFGYDVRTAEGGVKGLAAYRSAPADVVLLDMFMPDKDGLETLRELRQLDPHARVIAMTGGGSFHDVGILKPASLMGANKLLFKPVTMAELKKAVEETLAEGAKGKGPAGSKA